MLIITNNCPPYAKHEFIYIVACLGEIFIIELLARAPRGKKKTLSNLHYKKSL